MKTNIIPVIHFADDDQAMRNAGFAFDAGCEGVLLIEMRGRDGLLRRPALAIKERWPDRLVGINRLGTDPDRSLEANVADGLDMTWIDSQPTHSHLSPWIAAQRLAGILRTSPNHLLFAGVAFKHQTPEPNPAAAARSALGFGFVPTTSGAATGVAADISAIADIRARIGPDAPLAIASGVTPQNAHAYAPLLTHVLVATGVSRTFHDFDPTLLAELRSSCSPR